MFRYKLQKQPIADSGLSEIVLELRNASDEVIDDIDVSWNYDIPYDEEGQVELTAARPEAVPLGNKRGKYVEFGQIGEGPLLPGHSRAFIYPNEWLSELLSEIAALSCEDCQIRIRGNGDLIQSITGREFADWIDKEFIRLDL